MTVIERIALSNLIDLLNMDIYCWSMTIIVVAIFDVTLMCFVECNEYNFDLGS